MATTPGFVQITEGAGKRIAAGTYTENSQVVFDQKVLIGEPYLPTYYAQAQGVSVATVNDHLLQIMAGASLIVRLKWLHIEQTSNTTTVNVGQFALFRVSSAGTGGTAVTPAKANTADAAAGATAMTIPTAKGTETTELFRTVLVMRQALLATGAQPDDDFQWTPALTTEPPMIAAGTSNGIVIKNITAIAGAPTVNIVVAFTETSF